MKTKRKTHKQPPRKFLPREYGVGDLLAFLSGDGEDEGAVDALKRIEHQEKLLADLDPKTAMVN